MPYQLAVDGAGTVYVTDSGNHKIRKITPAGSVTTLTSPVASTGAASFNQPKSVAVDSAGTIYVADNCVSTITAAGAGTVIASPYRDSNRARVSQ